MHVADVFAWVLGLGMGRVMRRHMCNVSYTKCIRVMLFLSSNAL